MLSVIPFVLISIFIFLSINTNAQTIPPFKLPIVCDLNNDGFYTDAKGQVMVKANGDVQFNVIGLEPNAEYECSFFCSTRGNVFSTVSCFPDDDGDLKLLFDNAATDATTPLGQCVNLRIEIIRDVAATGIREQCLPGWDFSDM
ncbi:MAG: hypothetical protein ACREOW_10245 [Thermodesulfobacteriota bacterium]